MLASTKNDNESVSVHTWAGNCIVLQKPLAAGTAAIPAQVFHLSLEQWTPFWAAKAAMAAKLLKPLWSLKPLWLLEPLFPL